MNVRPLIVRELRAEARRANTYWLRSLAAALLTALFVWSTWNLQGGVELGPMLFQALSSGLLLAILIVVSGITAAQSAAKSGKALWGCCF